MKKLIVILLILAMFTCTAFAAGTSTFSVGKSTATYVTIPMDGSTKVTVTLGQNSVNKDMSFADHISKAASEFGATPSVSVNGTYFNAYYKTNQELGFPDNCANITQTVMINGRVVTGGGSGYKATLGITSDGRALIDNVEIKPYLEVSGSKYYSWGVNRNFVSNSTAVSIFTEELGYPVDIPETCKVLVISNGKISAVSSGSAGTEVSTGTSLVVFGEDAWKNAIKWNPSLKAGSSASIKTEFNPTNGIKTDWNKVVTAVAGNPWILSGGVDMTDGYTPTEAKLNRDAVLQRTFAGVKSDGTLIIGTVNASPAGLASVLATQGIVDAMLLDGGGSSALASNGKAVTSPGRKLANVIHFYTSGSGSAVSDPVKSDIPFTDVSASAYFRNAVKWAYQNQVTSGVSSTLFGPNESCTRGQVVTFLWRAAGKPSPAKTDNVFTDVKSSDYYYEAVLWAVEKGITTGSSATIFSPDEPCSNAHIVTFIWRALGSPDKTGQGSWYSDAITWAEKSGLLKGTYNGTFNIEANCPRANVVEYLYRYYSK